MVPFFPMWMSFSPAVMKKAGAWNGPSVSYLLLGQFTPALYPIAFQPLFIFHIILLASFYIYNPSHLIYHLMALEFELVALIKRVGTCLALLERRKGWYFLFSTLTIATVWIHLASCCSSLSRCVLSICNVVYCGYRIAACFGTV